MDRTSRANLAVKAAVMEPRPKAKILGLDGNGANDQGVPSHLPDPVSIKNNKIVKLEQMSRGGFVDLSLTLSIIEDYDLGTIDLARLFTVLASPAANEIALGENLGRVKKFIGYAQDFIEDRTYIQPGFLSQYYRGLRNLPPAFVGEEMLNALGLKLWNLRDYVLAHPYEQPMKPKAIDYAYMVFGLQNLDETVVDADNFFTPICDLLEADPELKFNEADLVHIFLGLQNFSMSPEIARLFDLVKERVPDDLHIKKSLSIQKVLRSLFKKGPENFSPAHFDKLARIVMNINPGLDYSFKDLSVILYGLHNFSKTNLYKFFTDKLREKSSVSLNDLFDQLEDPWTITTLFFALRLSQAKAKRESGAKEVPKHLRIPKLIDSAYKLIRASLHCNEPDDLPRSERVARDIVSQHRGANRHFKYNYFIDGVEHDMICLPKKLIVELDGVFHHGYRKSRDEIRDRHMIDSHGFRVVRIDTTQHNDIWQQQLKELLDKEFPE